jgi:exonuclease SbcD
MGKSRQEEHEAFLSWLLKTIERENITLLIVAGDIFDTGTPPNYALEMYYNFLTKLTCKDIIITAGNHDSIATLKAPKQLLKALNVYVITSGDESEDEIIKIKDEGKLQAIICAVPFLRDYVVRKSLSAQSKDEKEFSLTEGIKAHYNDVFKKDKKMIDGKNIPIIATGHLTTVGSKSSDSEREIYIGGTLDIDSDFLGKNFNYVALGHLHVNQKVGVEHVRYSGSPIPLSFSEANSQKKVNIITFEEKTLEIQELNIPLFRSLTVLKGNLESISESLEKIEDKNTWIEIHLDDKNPFHANQSVRELAKELELTLLAVKIDKNVLKLQAEDFDVLSLDELEPLEVFKRRLSLDEIENDSFKNELIRNFSLIVEEVKNR